MLVGGIHVAACFVFAFVSLEGVLRFAAGRAVGNAFPRYSCCCVFCNCCVFAFVFRFCKPSAALIRSLSFVVVAFYQL